MTLILRRKLEPYAAPGPNPAPSTEPAALDIVSELVSALRFHGIDIVTGHYRAMALARLAQSYTPPNRFDMLEEMYSRHPLTPSYYAVTPYTPVRIEPKVGVERIATRGYKPPRGMNPAEIREWQRRNSRR